MDNFEWAFGFSKRFGIVPLALLAGEGPSQTKMSQTERQPSQSCLHFHLAINGSGFQTNEFSSASLGMSPNRVLQQSRHPMFSHSATPPRLFAEATRQNVANQVAVPKHHFNLQQLSLTSKMDQLWGSQIGFFSLPEFLDFSDFLVWTILVATNQCFVADPLTSIFLRIYCDFPFWVVKGNYHY